MDQRKALQTISAIWGAMIYYTWQVRKRKLLKQTIVNSTFATDTRRDQREDWIVTMFKESS